jgi:hypothetical protein
MTRISGRVVALELPAAKLGPLIDVEVVPQGLRTEGGLTVGVEGLSAISAQGLASVALGLGFAEDGLRVVLAIRRFVC